MARGNWKDRDERDEGDDRDGEPDELVTDTGWRIKGQLAESLNGTGLALHPVSDAIWGGSFRVHSRGKKKASVLVIEELERYLSEVNRTEIDLSDELVIEGGELKGLYWSPGERGGLLLARHPHPAFARKACVTHLQITTLGGKTTIRIRVAPEQGVRSIRGPVGVGQIVPPWMTGMMDRAHYMLEGGVSRVLELNDHSIPGFVERKVLDPKRSFPLAVISPVEAGGYLVDPAIVARELLGIAHLYRITDHQHTFVLSDAVGDRHKSAFWGALRIYLPGFSRSDHAHTHPVLLSDRLTDPLMRASEFGALQLRRTPIELDLPLPQAYLQARSAEEAAREAEERARAKEARRAEKEEETPIVVEGAGNADDAQTRGAPATLPLPEPLLEVVEGQQALLADLREEMRRQRKKLLKVAGAVGSVQAEIEQMRTRMEMGGAEVGHITRQLDRANSYLQRLLPTPEVEEADLSAGAQSEGKPPDSHEILEVVRSAREKHPDDLAILDSAEASARESDFHDPVLVETILGAMAEISHQRQEGSLGRGLKAAFRDFGLTYQSSISKSSSERLRRQHEFVDEEGEVHFCEEHISFGISYDSRYCLRVYFSSKSAQEPRFVVGHVGKHLDTMSTS